MRGATGDAYPPAAAWAAHLIDQPYSPRGSGVPVVGIARQVGVGAGFEIRPGPGRWSDEAERRVTEIKAPDWALEIYYHVEMQVAAWMISSRLGEVELVLNREPCGERFGLGCHQLLPIFLPIGHRLWISGTRGGSRYYSCSYEGKARS